MGKKFLVPLSRHAQQFWRWPQTKHPRAKTSAFSLQFQQLMLGTLSPVVKTHQLLRHNKMHSREHDHRVDSEAHDGVLDAGVTAAASGRGH